MRISKLREIAEECYGNPNFQHKGLAKSEFQELAIRSFARLTVAQREAVSAEWDKECTLQGETFNGNEMVYLRFLAQTNLFFLCKLLEKYSQVSVNTHEEICNKFFVSKDPANYNRFEDYANAYKGLKERMLLVPRGGFKSSIDMADTVQWVISFPEVTILILTGVYALATDFVKEIKSHFLLQEIGKDKKDKPKYGVRQMNDGTHSLFQVLFREHCTKDEGTATEFQTPAVSITDKEMTVTAASIEQSLSGWHFGIMKLDDVVTNENSQTLTRLANVNKQISINKAMLNPFGFLDFIGTWYDAGDIYGLTIAAEEELSREMGRVDAIVGSIDHGRYNSSVNVEIYLRAAWWATDEALKLGKIEEEYKKEDYVLWFPERLTYEFLKKESKDREGFPIKYLNNPKKIHQIKFPKELLLRRTIPSNQLPSQGLIVTVVDTAYSVKSWADYTAIITAMISGGRFYIIDIQRGRYDEYNLPIKIATVGNQWKPKRVIIEDSTGTRWLRRPIQQEMDKLHINIPIEFVALGQGNRTKAKEIRAKPVARLLGEERLFFSNSSAGLEEAYDELSKFGTVSAVHDDMVDALSLLADQFGAYADMDVKINVAQIDFVANRQERERHDMLFGLGRYSHHNANSSAVETDHPVTNFELSQFGDVGSDYDPLEGVF